MNKSSAMNSLKIDSVRNAVSAFLRSRRIQDQWIIAADGWEYPLSELLLEFTKLTGNMLQQTQELFLDHMNHCTGNLTIVLPKESQ